MLMMARQRPKRSIAHRVRTFIAGTAMRVLAYLGFEGATSGRRWDRSTPHGSADDVVRWSLPVLRDRSRHLVRNHWAAKQSLNVLSGKIVGAGIVPSCRESKEYNAFLRLFARPQAQVGTEKGQSLLTVQRLVCRTVIESGSALVVRRWRTPKQMLDRGLIVPFQLSVLEPEFLDSTKDGVLGNGNEIWNGIEFDQTGWPVAYHIFDQHPDSYLRPGTATSTRVTAADVSHVFWQERPGQTIGVPWLAAVLLKINDWDEFEDAQLIRNKIAAMFAVFVKSVDFGDVPFSDTDDDSTEPMTLEPGRIQHLEGGEEVDFASPPPVDGFADFARVTLRSIAAGVGLTYEDLSNDYSQVNFSSSRMSQIVHRVMLDQWQNEMMIGLFCQDLDRWIAEGAEFLGLVADEVPETRWTPPRRELIDPSKEIGAIEKAMRIGVTSRQEEIRKLGRDATDVDNERIADLEREQGSGLSDEKSALNGAQTDSMVNLLMQVAGGFVPAESAVRILMRAYQMSEGDARRMVKPAEGFEQPEDAKAHVEKWQATRVRDDDQSPSVDVEVLVERVALHLEDRIQELRID